MPTVDHPPPPGRVPLPGSFDELRDEQRQRVDRPPQGRITLLAHNERQCVQLIRDVSAHGVSLVLEHALEPGEPVLIEQSPEPGHSPKLAPAEGSGTTPSSGPGEVAGPSQEPCVYRAYVVWCRDFEAASSTPRAHFVAGLRVHGPQSLEQLIQPAGAA
jgi:hypothetical protein